MRDKGLHSEIIFDIVYDPKILTSISSLDWDHS